VQITAVSGTQESTNFGHPHPFVDVEMRIGRVYLVFKRYVPKNGFNRFSESRTLFQRVALAPWYTSLSPSKP
jgi:hypothetical protein